MSTVLNFCALIICNYIHICASVGDDCCRDIYMRQLFSVRGWPKGVRCVHVCVWGGGGGVRSWATVKRHNETVNPSQSFIDLSLTMLRVIGGSMESWCSAYNLVIVLSAPSPPLAALRPPPRPLQFYQQAVSPASTPSMVAH